VTEIDVTGVPRTPAVIHAWLVERVALYLKVQAADIDPDVSLTENGLNSVYAHTLCADIEDTLGVYIEPPQLWDVDTVTKLTAYLADRTD
jgi:acyl carrier protein